MEDFVTPEMGEYSHATRHKFEKRGDKDPWANDYIDNDCALKASSGEYKLLDVRVSILNKMITPMDLAQIAQASLTYAGEYPFELTEARMEADDTLGNINEWLVPATPIPMLVERNIHFIFEVPNVVATSTDDLVFSLTINGEQYDLTLR